MHFVRCQALLNPHTSARIEREFPMPSGLAKVVQVVPRVRGAKDPDDRFTAPNPYPYPYP